MKTHWFSDNLKYDGSQLRSLYTYLNHNILGDSILGFSGPCDVTLDHMVDGEDLLEGSQIVSDHMLHFIIEKFDVKLFSAVCLQRLLSDICISLIQEMSDYSNMSIQLKRKGDDIYYKDQKLNISIATVSPSSTLIHYGINISNEGTPVKTLALKDFNIDFTEFAQKFMELFSKEVVSIHRATQKVKWVN